MNISLPEKMRKFIEFRTETLDYGSVSEYIRELVRRDQQALLTQTRREASSVRRHTMTAPEQRAASGSSRLPFGVAARKSR
jgi:putative addiction module CopG family antidote